MENNTEQLQNSGETQSLDHAAESAGRQIEKLQSREHESTKIESVESSRERAKAEAMESAASIESGGAEKQSNPNHTPAPATKRTAPLSKKQLNDSFDNTMKQVQKDLRGPSKSFSKFIHTKPVEKASEIVGSTVARPNAILSGSVMAFVVTLVVYVIARYYGYPLSGFETILAFIVGWIAGILFDYFRVLITGKVAK